MPFWPYRYFFRYGQTLKCKKAETIVTLHSNSHYSDYRRCRLCSNFLNYWESTSLLWVYQSMLFFILLLDYQSIRLSQCHFLYFVVLCTFFSSLLLVWWAVWPWSAQIGHKCYYWYGHHNGMAIPILWLVWPVAIPALCSATPMGVYPIFYTDRRPWIRPNNLLFKNNFYISLY